MKRFQFTFLTALFALSLFFGQAVWADDYQPEPGDTTIEPGELFTMAELDELLAPIALYPDPLLAQILPAATFVDQLDEAARYVRQYGQAGIDEQPWDVSVRAVAHYPELLDMMDSKYDWSVSLGQAYVNQPQDLLDAIQDLRAEARERGNLVSTPEQSVIIEDDYIRIIPAAPQVIYLPSYDPVAIYAEPLPSYGFISFGLGFTIGAWLNRDCDWGRHRIYYHGWRGSGWIDRSRPYVNTRRNVYIRNTQAVININRRVTLHDTVRYRENIRRNVESRREQQIVPALPRRESRPRGAESRGTQSPPASGRPGATPIPATSAPRTTPQRGNTITPPVPHPETNGLYRGRAPRGEQPGTNSGYGGYGTGRDATTYRERGQSSRETIRQQPAAPFAVRPGASGATRPAPGATAPRRAAPVKRSGGEQKQRR